MSETFTTYKTTPSGDLSAHYGNLIALRLDGTSTWASLERAKAEKARLAALGVGCKIVKIETSQIEID